MGEEGSMTEWRTWVCLISAPYTTTLLLWWTSEGLPSLLLGKRIVQLHTTLAIINSPSSGVLETSTATLEGAAERTPFTHPALAGLESLSVMKVDDILEKGRLAQLGNHYGLAPVIRWKPKKVSVAPNLFPTAYTYLVSALG